MQTVIASGRVAAAAVRGRAPGRGRAPTVRWRGLRARPQVRRRSPRAATAALAAAVPRRSARVPRCPASAGPCATVVEQGEWIRLELVRAGPLGRARHRPGPGRGIQPRWTPSPHGGDPAPCARRTGPQRGGHRGSRRAPACGSAWPRGSAAAARESRAGAPGPAPRPHPAGRTAGRTHVALQRLPSRRAAVGRAASPPGWCDRGLSLGSGYWVPVTVLFVLKPDYGTTMTRGIGTGRGNDGRGHHRLVARHAVLARRTARSWSCSRSWPAPRTLLFPANYALVLGRLDRAGRVAGRVQRRLAGRRARGPDCRHRRRHGDRPGRHHAVAPARGAADAGAAWAPMSRPRASGSTRSWPPTPAATASSRCGPPGWPPAAPARRPGTRSGGPWPSRPGGVLKACAAGAVLAAMDQVSECALVLAAAVHDGASRATRGARCPPRRGGGRLRGHRRRAARRHPVMATAVS